MSASSHCPALCLEPSPSPPSGALLSVNAVLDPQLIHSQFCIFGTIQCSQVSSFLNDQKTPYHLEDHPSQVKNKQINNFLNGKKQQIIFNSYKILRFCGALQIPIWE